MIIIDEQRKWFSWEKSTPDKDAIKTDEMTRDLRRYKNFADKWVVTQNIDWNFEKKNSLGKMLSNSMIYYTEMVHERKIQSRRQTSLLAHFKKLPQPPQISVWSVSTHQHWGMTLHQKKDYKSLKDWISIRFVFYFLNSVFKLRYLHYFLYT